MTNPIKNSVHNRLAYSNDNTSTTSIKIKDNTERFEIEIMDAMAKWIADQSSNSLENINLNVKPGGLVAVIGPVGAGKVCICQRSEECKRPKITQI